MKMRPHNKNRQSKQGFTLVEILIVISIIMVLAAMTIGGLSFANKKAKKNQTEIFIKSVSNALEQYREDNEDFPDGDGGIGSTAEVYNVLYGNALTDENAKIYLATLNPNNKGSKRNVKKGGSSYVLVDAWKDSSGKRQEIFYKYPGEMNPPGDFDLWSLGPDGKGGPGADKSDRADDISNW